MSDNTYQPKTYRKQGGDEFVIADGGKITQEDGGSVTRPVRTITAEATLDASESGLIVFLGAADLTVNLPATEAGVTFTFVMPTAGLSAAAGAVINPVSDDLITGGGLTGVVDKDLLLTGGNDALGDTVTIVGDGVDGWFITSIVGTWTKES